jgi:hypothetical protein
MVLARVQYDAYNRQFKLLDVESRHSLEDGEVYLLVVGVSPQDFASRDGDSVHVETAEHLVT